MLGLYVNTPADGIFEFVVVLFKDRNCFCIGYAGKIAVDNKFKAFLQSFVDKGIKELNFLGALFKHRSDCILSHCLSGIHIILKIRKCKLRLNHPEFRGMTGSV